MCVVALGLLLIAAMAAAQDRGRGGAPGQPAPAGAGRGRQTGPGYLKLFDSSMPFDAHDLAGIWSPNGNAFGGGGRCRDCGDRGYSFEFPMFTAVGQAAFEKNIPSYGRAKDSEDARAHPEEHLGRRRAQPPALGNDTYGTCNPMGMPRAILYPDPVEFIVLPDRIYQHFQWGYGLRTIWTDGRKLPKSEDIDLPRWWGYATSHWEGNTLVVDSTGYDERTWIDYFGYPHSDEMVLQERYTRLNFDTLELKMTITDPVMYTKPWVAETKTFKLIPKGEVNGWYEKMTDLKGWYGLMEEICAPVDEVDNFNRRVRDPAGGVTH